MKFRFFTLLAMVAFTFMATTEANSQCTMIGLIGEPTAWADDIVMNRDAENPAVFTMFITLTAEQDTDANGFVDVKFRQLGDWGNNWGDPAFPSGTGVADGDNIQGLPGTYFVTFNCETGAYSFESTCAHVGLIGEPTAWADDIVMDRSTTDISVFTTIITLTAEQDTDANGFVDVKFRQLGDWGNNWGDAAFPSGTGVADGDNIQALPGTYLVTFNCSTGAYTFESSCAHVGLIGEPTAWADDIVMDRGDDINVFTTTITLTAEQDTDANGFVDVKFRQLGDWGNNWGDAAFPSGTGVADGDNIQALPGIYFVTFNCSTGAYNFEATCGEIGMIGEFNNWNGDFPMNRDAVNPNMWTTVKSLSNAHDGDSDGDIEVKFRQDADWTSNWGNPAFPSGVATSGGDNILAIDGTYDVSFNCATGAYSFVTNDDVCGDIGIIGDFNTWGTDEDGVVSDVNLVRDPNSPSQFSLDYSFTSSTKLLFRENADQIFTDVWGGSTFPSGTGVADGGVTQLDVPGGNYRISFNCTSGDYNFERLGSSVSAPKVFALSVDGDPSEADWDFTQNVSQVADGAAGDDPVTADFAVAYNDEFLYVAGRIVDAMVISDGAEDNDAALIYVDGNKNGGDYDDSDIALTVYTDGTFEVSQGSAGITPSVAVAATADGYAVEVSIAWADLGVTPEEGGQIGFDFGAIDVDDAGYQSTIMWNGNTGNADKTSAFGDLLFGALACGELSLYSDMIGDVSLETPTETPSTYVATYMFEDPMNVVFRKDNDDVVSWGVDAFPTGNAVVGGDAIPVAAGRYRVAFSCLDGAFSFTEEAAGDEVALANYSATGAVVDGDLSEYSLDYGMDAGVVVGAGPDNNTVTWGALWDEGNLYLAAHVVDAVVEGSGNPWDNDAIEMYFDGNHDSDGAIDADFDTQLILDAMGESTLWIKADGVPITDFESNWTATADGYNIELRLAWSNFGFSPGRNRAMGFSMANNDSDNGIGRDYQTTWVGTADNWNNTALHGDLQLAGGPLNVDTGTEEPVFYNESLTLFPNPVSSKGAFLISSDGEIFTGKTQLNVYNLVGQNVRQENVDFSTGAIRVESNNLTTGTYFVHLLSEDGKQAVKKVIIR